MAEALNLPSEDAVGEVRKALAHGRCLVMLLGAPRSGKSTLARQVADPHQVLSTDGLRKAVSDNGNDQDATGEAIAVLHLLADARLRRGLSTLIDATNAEASARAPLLAMARRYRVPAIAVVMATPLQECLARNATRPGPPPGSRWGQRVPDDFVRRTYDQIQEVLPALTSEGFTGVVVVTRVRPDQHGVVTC